MPVKNCFALKKYRAGCLTPPRLFLRREYRSIYVKDLRIVRVNCGSLMVRPLKPLSVDELDRLGFKRPITEFFLFEAASTAPQARAATWFGESDARA